MQNTDLRKRPCSICRKWFLPDVRQKGRQTTCSPECRKERHRRQCERWNRENKSYFKDIYLGQKLDGSAEPPPAKPPPTQTRSVLGQKMTPTSSRRLCLDLPSDVIENELGERKVIILDYYMKQIIHHLRPNVKGFGSG